MLCGFTKNPVYRGGSHEKLICRGELPKNGWLGPFEDLREGKKKWGCF